MLVKVLVRGAGRDADSVLISNENAYGCLRDCLQGCLQGTLIGCSGQTILVTTQGMHCSCIAVHNLDSSDLETWTNLNPIGKDILVELAMHHQASLHEHPDCWKGVPWL